MPPRIQLFSATRVLPIHPRPSNVCPLQLRAVPKPRCFADKSKDLPVADNKKGPNSESLPHVSEEAASMAQTTGTEGPDINQGTPIDEVVQGDKEAQENLPQVMKDDMKNSATGSKRSFSTLARMNRRQFSTSAIRRQEVSQSTSHEDTLFQPELINSISSPQQASVETPSTPGVKFGLPTLPLPPGSNHKYRYDPLVEQMVGLLVRNGKKSVAQRNMGLILNHLRSASPPSTDPRRPLVPGAPPPSHLPLHPILYLTVAVDSVAPLIRIKSIRGAAGGGMALQLPNPLGLRQRRRVAIKWILDAASKRKNTGSGKGGFAQRVAQELIAVVEGRSGVWDRRGGIHKLGVAARANMMLANRRKR